MNIFIDIETIPDQREGAASAASSRISAPSNYKDPDKIKAYVEEKGAEAWRKTSLDGTYGQLFCIGFAINDEPAMVGVAADLTLEAEAALLCSFWDNALGGVIPTKAPVWIGHNVAFDLSFLWKRHVVHQVQPLTRIPHGDAPWSGGIGDTMITWTGQRTQFISLDELLSALSIPSGDPIEGSEVWDYVSSGATDVVVEHCRRNVEETREAWKRMRLVGI